MLLYTMWQNLQKPHETNHRFENALSIKICPRYSFFPHLIGFSLQLHCLNSISGNLKLQSSCEEEVLPFIPLTFFQSWQLILDPTWFAVPSAGSPSRAHRMTRLEQAEVEQMFCSSLLQDIDSEKLCLHLFPKVNDEYGYSGKVL